MNDIIVDISSYQDPKKIDYDVFASSIAGAILRVGYTGWGTGNSYYYDKAFSTHERELRARGVPLGVYWYSCADTPAEGMAEAKLVIDKIKGRKWDLPIYIDVEDNHHQAKAGKPALTAAVKTFCERIESMGYYAGIYSTQRWMNLYMDSPSLAPFDFWRAHWTANKPTDGRPFNMWQYTSDGSVPGYDGRLDLNRAYVDYPSIMKANGLNGYPTPKDSYIKRPNGGRPVVNSPFFLEKVQVTCLMDPGRVQHGIAAPLTRQIKVASTFWAAYPGHEGVDLAGALGSTIYAAMTGRVVNAGTGHRFMGNYVMIQAGHIKIGLYHLDKVYVKRGDTVRPATKIGTQGATGNVTGPHLHVSLWINDRYADPLPFVSGEKKLDDLIPTHNKTERKFPSYPPGDYRVTSRVSYYDEPKGKILGGLEKGDRYEAVEEIRTGVPGVWHKTSNGHYIPAEWDIVHVEQLKPVDFLEFYPENARFIANTTINVRSGPSTDYEVVGQYTRGDGPFYDEVIITEQYVWIAYTAASGHRRYMAVRPTGQEAWGEFV